MSQTADVLFVDPARTARAEFGAEVVVDFTAAREYLKDKQPSLIVFGQGRGTDADDFCRFSAENFPQTRWIVNEQGISPTQLRHWCNFASLFALIDGLEDPSLEDKLREGLQASGEIRQDRKLAEMVTEQAEQLKRLSQELESRVQKRQKTLGKSLRTLDQTKTRLEAFHRALLGIHRASTILQMESTLNEALRDSMDIEWVRVRFANQSLLSQKGAENLLAIDLPFANEKQRGEVIFCKRGGGKFTTAESDFLSELSEGLALALSRLHKLDQAETLKAQWQATFDSISHALCLTTADYEILKLNRAFQEACAPQSFRELIGKNCFSVFFGNDFHPPHGLASPFRFRNSRSGTAETDHFEVVGETLGLTVDNQSVQLILIRRITDEVRFERRILEASKLAELGTIGSSIAHELNNPLGGMLSFLQLILMDLKPSAGHYSEIKAMENAVFRCRDIVLNLLSFARKQDLGEFTTSDLRAVFERTIKLSELQTKSKGINISCSGEAAPIKASPNALAQAFTNIVQNAIDAITEKIKLDPLFPGKINIQWRRENLSWVVRIADNGMGIAPENQSRIFNPLFTTRDPNVNRGMGLTTAFTIISEHQGTLEILSQTGSGTTAIITLPALG